MPDRRLVTVPHFDLPFRIGTSVAQVQQDTLEDVTNCVEVCVRTHVGRRKELPEFGIQDLTLNDQPIQMGNVLSQLTKNEPRATVLIDQHTEVIDELIADVIMSTSLREEPAS